MKREFDEFAWRKLSINASLANSVEDIDRNIESALKLDYIKLSDIAGSMTGAVAVVGSGPSLKKTWVKLKDFDGDIIACNASCKFLLERGIIPKYFFCFDADPLMLEFIIPHPEITYLIASRCPPQTLEILKGCKVVLWHASGDPNIEEILEKNNKCEAMVIGGGAAVSRAIFVARYIGYSTLHIFGTDGSFDGKNTHIQQSTTKEKRMLVMMNNRVFETAPWMALQLEDFKILAPLLRDQHGTKMIFHGDGLISHLAKTLGFKVYGENVCKFFLRNLKTRFLLLWSAL